MEHSAVETAPVSVFVTGSADGIGRETARQLLDGGHRVVGHARDADRADDLRAALPGLAGIATGDLASLQSTRELAAAATALGPYDVVIHNAGISRNGEPRRQVTGDGLEATFQVNVVAPYLLTALMPVPSRLVYLTSGLQSEGTVELADLGWERRPWSGWQAYCDSKLHDVVLAFAVARRYSGVISNAVDPGWIRTRLGGPNAEEPLPPGAETQVWLATSDEPGATASGRYLKRRRDLVAHPAAADPAVQDALLAELARLTGAVLPD